MGELRNWYVVQAYCCFGKESTVARHLGLDVRTVSAILRKEGGQHQVEGREEWHSEVLVDPYSEAREDPETPENAGGSGRGSEPDSPGPDESGGGGHQIDTCDLVD